MSIKTAETHLQGTPICQGIAIGKPFFYSCPEVGTSLQQLNVDDIEQELDRFRDAIAKSREDIQALQEKLKCDNISDGVSILDAHLQLIDDPLIVARVEKEIGETSCNAEFVFLSVIEEFQKKFNALSDPYFQERFKDLQDISRRVMGYLCASARHSLSDIPAGSIVFTHELIASDAAEANSQIINAFVSEVGGMTSHAAIVAKAKGMPFVTNIDFSSLDAVECQSVIVDGRTGKIIINPFEETLLKYKALNHQQLSQLAQLNCTSQLPAETYDGYSVTLSANIEMINEIDTLHQHMSHGVGLFRSEYLFLTHSELPHEEEQFEIYRSLVESMNGLPIVIRSFDIGGDKYLPNQKTPTEGNPFLGCRAIRFLLKEPEIFKSQLRAILRASYYGKVSLMFPMVSALTELLEAKQVVKEVQKDLEEKNIPHDPNIRIGCMIEVPSAAIIADLLAKECDFLSIGTNDLVQYSLAVDRSSHTMSGLYTPAHPSVIRLIKLVVTEANNRGIPVTVCGEVASDPRFTPLLLGLGINELSVTLRYLPIIKQAIRKTSIVAASQLAEKVLALATPDEIESLLNEEYRKHSPNDFLFNLS